MPGYLNNICDRSPCSRLLAVLGRLIHGAVGEDGVTEVEPLPSDKQEDGKKKTAGFAIFLEGFAPVYVTYCPFCGTRLDCVNIEILTRFRHRKTPTLRPAAPPPIIATPVPPVRQVPVPPPIVIQELFFGTSFIRPRTRMAGKIHKPVLPPVHLSRRPSLWAHS